MEFSVSARDPVDNMLLEAQHTVTIVGARSPPIVRTLFSADYALDYPVFFNGGRQDRIINAKASMLQGCSVLNVRGVPLCKDSDGRLFKCPGEITSPPSFSNWDGTPLVTYNSSTRGFTVSRPSGLDDRNLRTNIHQWHDGLTEIRTKVVYDVSQPSGIDCSMPGATSENP
jgi:hypothetical protein